MKRVLKSLLIIFVPLSLLVIVAPFAILALGPESTATSVRMLLNVLAGYNIDSPAATTIQQRFVLADGFALEVYAQNLGKIRFMHITEQGDLLLSRPRSGDILLLERDRNQDGFPDAQRVLLSGLTKPHGMDIADGWLYIAESTAVGKVHFDTKTAALIGDYERIVDGLSDNGNHWSKTLQVGPDGWLYLTAGSTCNVCVEEDQARAAMLRFDTDGNGLEIYATGLRNSVDFDWAPWDQSLYATDNGRDLLGDDFPPCELNKIVKGGFYGWPFINGFGVPDPDMVKSLAQKQHDRLSTALSPAHGFRAHNAPLGITFIRHNRNPAFNKTALVALHGSWNRSQRDGYKIVSLHWQEDGSIVEKDFLTGFKHAEEVIGRPVDVVEALDGRIYISDDYSGSVYRVSPSTMPTNRVAVESVSNAFNKPLQAINNYTAAERDVLRTEGEKLFVQHACQTCHSTVDGRSTGPSLHNLALRYSPNQLADFFITPTLPMPIFPLDSRQREALAVYLLSI